MSPKVAFAITAIATAPITSLTRMCRRPSRRAGLRPAPSMVMPPSSLRSVVGLGGRRAVRPGARQYPAGTSWRVSRLRNTQ